MATFHTDEGFFSLPSPRSIKGGQGEMAATHAMPLLKAGGGEGKGSDRMHRKKIKTNKAERLSVHLGGLLMKSVAQKSLAIFL